MQLSEHIRMAFASLVANKMRSLLTMLGMIIGVGSVVAISSVGNGITGAISDSFERGTSNAFTLNVTSRDDDSSESSLAMALLFGNDNIEDKDRINDKMIESLRMRFDGKFAEIGASTYIASGHADDLRQTALSFRGLTAEGVATENVPMLSGRSFTEDDITGKRRVAIVPENFLKRYFGSSDDSALGKTFSATTNGKKITFTIIGIYENAVTSGFINMLGFDTNEMHQIYVPYSLNIDLAASSQTVYSGYSSIKVKGLNLTDDLDDLAAEMADYLTDRYYANNKDYKIAYQYTPPNSGNMIGDVFSTVSMAISAIAGISLVVAGIGVMNIMLVSVTERTREIGIRKALGATNQDIRRQFIIEAVILCVVGGMIGVVLGAVAAYLVGIRFDMNVYPSVGSVITAFGVSVLVGIFFGTYPANRAAKLDPIEALRYE